MKGEELLFSSRSVIAEMWPKRHGTPAFRASLRRLVRLTRAAR